MDLLVLYLTGVLRRTQEFFAYTTVADIMVHGRKPRSTQGKSTTARRLLQSVPLAARAIALVRDSCDIRLGKSAEATLIQNTLEQPIRLFEDQRHLPQRTVYYIQNMLVKKNIVLQYMT